jgi:DNA/RNA endonuclease YhcR with UshA esterase domain
MFKYLTALLTFGARVFAGDTNTPSHSKIGTAEATNYYDQIMIVTGKVAQVSIRPTVTFLNLDKPYPDSPFTIVIFHGHSSFYGDANSLKGKSVEIEGKIKSYHNAPEIALDNTNQLTAFDSNGNIMSIPRAKSADAPPAFQNSSTNPPPANPPPKSSSTNLSEIL